MAGDGDSFCGIYCGACSVLRYGETGRNDGFVDCLGRVPKEEIACKGCKSDSVYPGCRVCALRDCAVEKGVAHCADCAEYPCKRYARWQSAARLLPHVREAKSSSEAIKRDGVDAWLAAQKKRWSCARCGAPFSWYAAACSECGLDVSREAFALSGLQRILCRVVLPGVYRKGKSKTTRR